MIDAVQQVGFYSGVHEDHLSIRERRGFGCFLHKLHIVEALSQ